MNKQIPKLSKFGLAVIENNRLLLCEPFAFPDLILPGGLKEGSETHIENLTREVREELGEGAVLEISSLQYLGRFQDLAAGRTERIVEIDLYYGHLSGTLRPSTEIKALHWFGPDDSEEVLSPILKNHIIPYLVRYHFLTHS
jgi:8-oxo-dGTP pyrophosphatase MutT (NUDIX family)